MEQTNMVLTMFQTMAAQGMAPKTGKAGDKAAGDFQKLLDQKAQSSSKTDAPVEQKPKADAANQEEDGAVQEEDPIERSKKLQVYLAPLTAEELSQYPAAWIPQVEEGEPIVCIGVRAGANGEDIPILVGAKQAAQMYGKQMVDPALYDVSDPEADAMLEMTAPGADLSPAHLLEKALDEQAGEVIQQTVEEANPQQKDDQTVEVVDVEQPPQQLFHDVKAAPIKVGEVYTEQPVDEANVVNQVDTQLAQALQTGETMVRIQLTPENLGEVTVEITQTVDGALRIALSAHNDSTRGLLERHASDLQGMLSNRTEQSVEVSVQRQQESQQNQNQQHNYDGHNGHAQDGQERRQRREHTSPEDFMQQLRLGLISDDGGF